jgi:hypothetical protein
MCAGNPTLSLMLSLVFPSVISSSLYIGAFYAEEDA